MRLHRPQPGLLVADGLLDDGMRRLAPSYAPFTVQRVGPGGGRDGLPERREHTSTDAPAIAALLWERLAPHLPPLSDWFEPDRAPRLSPPIEAWHLQGCNDRIRYYRYGKGDRFAPHVDESHRFSPLERTLLTVLIYLPTPEPCTGGETVVNGEVIPVELGRAAIFDHRLLHEGRPVEAGQKLVLRTDLVAAVA